MQRPKETSTMVILPALACLAMLSALAPASLANHGPAKASHPAMILVGHVALPAGPASQMFVQERNGKRLLYLESSSTKKFTVVDVTNPERPRLLERASLPEGARSGSLVPVGNRWALAEASERASAATPGRPAAQTVEVLDLSDDANPQIVQTFDRVTSLIPDDSRSLVYLTNDQGLWILRLRPQTPAPHPCTSADALNPLPDCE